jgi:hypothetical protein
VGGSLCSFPHTPLCIITWVVMCCVSGTLFSQLLQTAARSSRRLGWEGVSSNTGASDTVTVQKEGDNDKKSMFDSLSALFHGEGMVLGGCCDATNSQMLLQAIKTVIRVTNAVLICPTFRLEILCLLHEEEIVSWEEAVCDVASRMSTRMYGLCAWAPLAGCKNHVHAQEVVPSTHEKVHGVCMPVNVCMRLNVLSMCVCAFVCAFVQTYLYVCVCVCVCVCKCICICIYVYVQTHSHIPSQIHIHLHVYVNIHIHIRTNHTYTYTYTYTYTHTRTHINMYAQSWD